MKTYELPKEAKKIIEDYAALDLGGKKIVCPYYINAHKSKDLRAMVGKGTPEEIIMEAQIWEKLKGANFKRMSEKEITDFLIERGLGIDCSGFVMHVLNYWYKAKSGKSIWRKMTIPQKSFLKKLAFLLKPVEKLGTDIITNQENSKKIKIDEVLPGDLIRSKWKKKNSHHVLMVSKVVKEKGKTKEIEYVNSVPKYDHVEGIRYGKIVINHSGKPLKDQKWEDEDKHGVNHIYEGYLINVKDNGLRRLNAMEDILKEEYKD